MNVKRKVPTRLELVTFCVLSRRDNHYTMEPNDYIDNWMYTSPNQSLTLTETLTLFTKLGHYSTKNIWFGFKMPLAKKIRCEQGSNLRGKIPLDFKSNALTTRPSQLIYYPNIVWSWSLVSST